MIDCLSKYLCSQSFLFLDDNPKLVEIGKRKCCAGWDFRNLLSAEPIGDLLHSDLMPLYDHIFLKTNQIIMGYKNKLITILHKTCVLENKHMVGWSSTTSCFFSLPWLMMKLFLWPPFNRMTLNCASIYGIDKCYPCWNRIDSAFSCTRVTWH